MNWSRGSILGATLTLTQRDGNLVIAFAAFFVTLVAARFWRILCICVHRLYSTPELRDALHHQRRVILRNSSPQSDLWRLLGLTWSSKGVYERHFLRMYPMSLVALLCIAGFTVITYFLPLLSSSTGAEVLLAPRVCIIFNRTLASQTNNTEYTTVAQSWWTENTVSAGSYAQQCYANSSGSLDGAGVGTDRIPSYINREAACSFHPDMCQNSTNSLSISTGLVDTNDILGMNRPKNDRVLFNTTLYCSPIATEGHTSTRYSKFKSFTRYNYWSSFGASGPRQNTSNSEGTYVIEDIEYQNRLENPTGVDYPLPSRSFQIEYVKWKVPSALVIPPMWLP